MKSRTICALTLMFISTITFGQLTVTSNGDVGIGITPAEKLHINGSIRGDQPSGSIKIQTSSGYTTIGANNSGWTHIQTDRNEFYFNKPIRVSGDGFIGSYSGDLTLRTGSYSRMYVLVSNGFVGINDSSPSFMLDVNGDIATYGVLRISSDKRLKKEISDIDAQKVSDLYNLQAKTYLKDNSLLEIGNEVQSSVGDSVVAPQEVEIDTTQKIGFIAQELMEYYPNLVKQDNKGFYSIDYVSLIPVLVEALKDQNNRIVELESRSSNYKTSEELQGYVASSIEPNSQISSAASLQQNIPNPFNEKTRIKYSIPSIEHKAVINIYDLQGSQVKSYEIANAGEGELMVPASELNPGLYIYNLIVDGVEVSSKRMVLTD